jgi:hypothetical protein
MKYIKNIIPFFAFFMAIFCGFFVFVNPQIAHASTTELSPIISDKEMQAVGLVWLDTKNILPQQHIIIFEKSVA